MNKNKKIPLVEPEILSHPFVVYLLAKIEKLEARVLELESENKRLKNLPKKPKISASTIDKNPKETARGKGRGVKRAGSKKKARDLEIDEEKIVKAEGIPCDWTFVGYADWEVSDLKFEKWNICYKREIWVSPCKTQRKVADLPLDLQGSHFGACLKAYVLNQYHSCGVTQPLLYHQLEQLGVLLSQGQLNNLLIEDNELFEQEKEAILEAGLRQFNSIQTDDTGARHQGKNGFCNCICNDYFTYFKSTSSKSWINFLEILHGTAPAYRINDAAMEYVREEGLAKKYQQILLADLGKVFEDTSAFQQYLAQHQITDTSHARRFITEGCLIGSLIHRGISPELAIHSDGARQFDLFVHSLCWKHAERPLKKLIAHNEEQQMLIDQKMHSFWMLYQRLKSWKQKPKLEMIPKIEQQFDQLTQPTDKYLQWDLVLEKLAKNKKDLLRVLKRPEIPLQNNLAERDIREYVKRRKISGSTRSEKGRKARDTFASLKKTCTKLNISFWEFLLDRIQHKYSIPKLPQLLLLKQLNETSW